MGADNWIRLYTILLHLYPSKFRLAFGSEMCEVFACVLADARRQGFPSLLRFGLREFGELPYSALREYCAPLINGIIAVFGKHPVWAGTVGYGLGFALLRIPGALEPVAPWFRFWLDNAPAHYLLVFLSGWLGGSLLGLSIRREGSRWFGLLGGLSQLVANLVVMKLYFLVFPNGNNRPPESIASLLIIFAYPMLYGLFIGGIMGSFQENWKYILRFAGYAVGGFLLAYLANRFVAALIQSYLINPAQNPFPTLIDVWEGIFLVSPQLIYGTVIGAALGLANRKSRMLRTRVAV